MAMLPPVAAPSVRRVVRARRLDALRKGFRAQMVSRYQVLLENSVSRPPVQQELPLAERPGDRRRLAPRVAPVKLLVVAPPERQLESLSELGLVLGEPHPAQQVLKPGPQQPVFAQVLLQPAQRPSGANPAQQEQRARRLRPEQRASKLAKEPLQA
jgi:hypothetical protein